jgi:hypothetical protein
MRPLPHWHTAPTAWFIPPVTAADTPVAIPLGVLQPAADTRRTAEEVEALRAAVAVRIPPVEVAATAAEVPLVAARVVEEAVVEEAVVEEAVAVAGGDRRSPLASRRGFASSKQVRLTSLP